MHAHTHCALKAELDMHVNAIQTSGSVARGTTYAVRMGCFVARVAQVGR